MEFFNEKVDLICLALDAPSPSSSWFLMSSPWPTACVFIVYVILIRILGSRLMNKKRICNLKVILIFYNIIQVTMNVIMLFKMIDSGALEDYKSHCTHFTLIIVDICWFYFMSKFVDLLDTIFLVIDKRYDQVSGVNVFYDGYTLLSVWTVVKVMPAGQLSIFMAIDMGIHVVTHLYCLLSWTRPRSNSVILLAFNFFQSLLILLHGVELVLWNCCNSPAPFGLWIVAHSVLLLIVFRSRFRKVQKRKQSIKPDNGEFNLESTYVSFNYGTEPSNDIKKRYVTTLKSHV